uniref:Uncharacterized protein n=1 Tax=Timema douglasi TaxID=61478 RepID=A0A7R8VHM3_TIMDO|nr:unnamed protein product [Timema douglasi]
MVSRVQYWPAHYMLVDHDGVDYILLEHRSSHGQLESTACLPQCYTATSSYEENEKISGNESKRVDAREWKALEQVCFKARRVYTSTPTKNEKKKRKRYKTRKGEMKRFSQTSNYLTDNRTCLSEASIRGLQTTKDGLKHYNYQCNSVSFTKNFIKKGHVSCTWLDSKKRIEAERKKQEQEDKAKIKNQSGEFQANRKVLEKKSQEAKREPLRNLLTNAFDDLIEEDEDDASSVNSSYRIPNTSHDQGKLNLLATRKC